MVTEKEAMDIAGKFFVEYFGREFISQNKERFAISWEKPRKGIRIFHFAISQEKLNKSSFVEIDGGIYVEENNFPERLLSLEVALKDGSVRMVAEIDS